MCDWPGTAKDCWQIRSGQVKRDHLNKERGIYYPCVFLRLVSILGPLKTYRISWPPKSLEQKEKIGFLFSSTWLHFRDNIWDTFYTKIVFFLTNLCCFFNRSDLQKRSIHGVAKLGMGSRLPRHKNTCTNVQYLLSRSAVFTHFSSQRTVMGWEHVRYWPCPHVCWGAPWRSQGKLRH